MDNLMIDFQGLRFAAGFNSRSAVSKYLQVNISTVNRWENKQTPVPFAVCELMKVLRGELPAVGRRQSWAGWSFSGDYIYTPNNERFTDKDILDIRFLHAAASAYREEILNLKNQIDLLSKQSLPNNVIPFPKKSAGENAA